MKGIVVWIDLVVRVTRGTGLKLIFEIGGSFERKILFLWVFPMLTLVGVTYGEGTTSTYGVGFTRILLGYRLAVFNYYRVLSHSYFSFDYLQ